SWAHDCARPAEAVRAFRGRDAVGVVGAAHAATADTELEPALADVVDGGDLLGDAQRMVQRQHLNRGAHADTPGPGRDRARNLQRRRDDRDAWREVERAEA